MSLLLREQFKAEMEETLKECVGLGFEKGRYWETFYKFENTDKSRVEVDQYVHPSVIAITKEAAPLNRVTVRRGWNSAVAPDTLTGEVKISHEFMRDNKYKEIQKGSFGLGKAMQRKRYKDACAFIYGGFTSVMAPDSQPVFSSNHQLVGAPAGVTGSNLLTAALNSDSLDQAVSLLLTQLDENGDVLPTDLGDLQLLVAPYGKRNALQLVKSPYEPENMNNAVNVHSGSVGEYNISVVCAPLMHEAPAAFRQQQWYLREASEAENTFYERESQESWMVPDTNSLCMLQQCKDSYGIVWHDWRCFIGSKGLA